MCFLDLTEKIFFYFVVFDQFNVLLLIMLLYCHKIVEYIIRTTLSNKILISKGRVTNKPYSHLSKNRRAELLWTMVLQFLLQEKEDRRSKAHWSCSFLSKEPLSKGATDMNELYCWIFNLNISIYIYITLFHLMVHFRFCKMNVLILTKPAQDL